MIFKGFFSSNPTTYSIDHFYKVKKNLTEIPVAILYGNIGKSEEFLPFHNKLTKLANEGKLLYVLRHYDFVFWYLFSLLNITPNKKIKKNKKQILMV